MDYFLTEEQQFMKDVAKEIAEKKMKPVVEHYDRSDEFHWPIIEAMAEADLFRCLLYTSPSPRDRS